MTKKYKIPLKLHNGEIALGSVSAKLKLPKRCIGMLFVFETKKAAIEFMGNDSDIIEVEIKE